MEITALELNGWHVATIATPFVLPASLVEQALALVRSANAAFVREDTAAWRLLNDPTPIGRLDFTITSPDDSTLTAHPNGAMTFEGGVVRPYEWEERPGGIGVTTTLNHQFAGLFSEARKDWPDIHVVLEDGRRGNDDHLWAEVADLECCPDHGLLLVRAEPGRKEFHGFADRSISTLRTKGDKSYGARLGWWKKVRTLAELPTGVNLVLKPLQGSKTNGLLMCPSRSLERQGGMVTRAKLEREFLKQVEWRDGMYHQPWHPPIEYRGMNMILRVFFARGFSSSPEWRCLGGVWNARNSAVVHGASDTIFGPAILG